MLKKIIFIILFSSASLFSQYNVKVLDLCQKAGIEINGIGPFILATDIDRDRVIAGNTLSSIISIIDGKSYKVTNVPIGSRGLQHLKNEALTINRKTGEIYFIATRSFCIVNPETKKAITIPTEHQYECIAVDENSGNVFLVGRESSSIAFYNIKKGELKLIPWLEKEEKLMNINQTPPPPIRKIISAPELSKIIAIDGYEGNLYFINPNNCLIEKQRKIEMSIGGRWHKAGYDESKHCIYLVTESTKRQVLEVGKIDIINGKDAIVKMPSGYTEPAGISYNPKLEQVYIPYDNHPTVHSIDFSKNMQITEIKIPSYGNDGSAIDIKNDKLFVASWAFGEIEVIDLKTLEFEKKIEKTGIIPHMFAFTYNPNNGKLYYPIGASAVNGCFGSAITMIDPKSEKKEKIYLGWAAIDLIEVPDRSSFFVFNNEDQFAEVTINGKIDFHSLPYNFPILSGYSPKGNIYLSYGPHQSYWPVVYIWDAKNGILNIDKNNLNYYDRRIQRQAMQMVVDKNKITYLTQNCWGKEKQFLNKIEDDIRYPDIGKRLETNDSVERETTQRILKYDEKKNCLYLARIAENDKDPGILQIINLDSSKVVHRIEIGKSPTDLIYDDNNIWISNFESDNITHINLADFSVNEIKVGIGSLRLCKYNNNVLCLNHLDNTISFLDDPNVKYKLPQEGYPDNLIKWGDKLIITAFNKSNIYIYEFAPENKSFKLIYENNYPYGDTRFDRANSAFYLNGQFGDAIFSLSKLKIDKMGNLWISDFLSGRVYIINKL